MISKNQEIFSEDSDSIMAGFTEWIFKNLIKMASVSSKDDSFEIQLLSSAKEGALQSNYVTKFIFKLQLDKIKEKRRVEEEEANKWTSKLFKATIGNSIVNYIIFIIISVNWC